MCWLCKYIEVAAACCEKVESIVGSSRGHSASQIVADMNLWFEIVAKQSQDIDPIALSSAEEACAKTTTNMFEQFRSMLGRYPGLEFAFGVQFGLQRAALLSRFIALSAVYLREDSDDSLPLCADCRATLISNDAGSRGRGGFDAQK